MLSDVLDIERPETTNTSFGNVFVLPAHMTIESVEETAYELRQLLHGQHESITLNAGKVEYITTPGLQMIVALEKALSKTDRKLSITHAQENFIRAFQDVGLQGWLQTLCR